MASRPPVFSISEIVTINTLMSNLARSFNQIQSRKYELDQTPYHTLYLATKISIGIMKPIPRKPHTSYTLIELMFLIIVITTFSLPLFAQRTMLSPQRRVTQCVVLRYFIVFYFSVHSQKIKVLYACTIQGNKNAISLNK